MAAFGEGSCSRRGWGAGRAAPPDGGADAKKLGDLDPAIVAREIRSRLGSIKACYEQALKANPQLSGKLVAHFTIEACGSVGAISWDEDTLGDKAVDACIQSNIAAWRFPPPTGGAVEISFPFVFQASQGTGPTAPAHRSLPAAGKSKKGGNSELPVRSRLALGADAELISTLSGVDQDNDGQTPHLEITRRRGHAAGVLTFDFSSAKYPAFADVIQPSFFWTVESSFVQLGSKRIARVGLVGRAGDDLMVLQEIAILVDLDGETPRLLWLGLGDREENTFAACVVTTRATFKLARWGVLERTRRSTKWVTRMTDPELDEYRQKCHAPAVQREEFPLAGE